MKKPHSNDADVDAPADGSQRWVVERSPFAMQKVLQESLAKKAGLSEDGQKPKCRRMSCTTPNSRPSRNDPFHDRRESFKTIPHPLSEDGRVIQGDSVFRYVKPR